MNEQNDLLEGNLEDSLRIIVGTCLLYFHTAVQVSIRILVDSLDT
jgi:hypothetical protein